MVQKIEFQGKEYILVGEAITTSDDYKRGLCSFARLCPSGNISRFGELIGTKTDIIFGDMIEIEIDTKKAFAGLSGATWPRNQNKQSST